MAGPGFREPAFSNDEKNYILAEIFKSVSPPPAVLLSHVMQMGIQPRWEDIPLPPGRSLNACRAAFEDLKRMSGYSPLSQTMGPQTPLSAPIGPLKRPWQPDPTSYSAGAPGRQIAPKPEPGTGVLIVPQAPPSATGVKRKRGRPTKAETQAKAEAAAAGASMRSESVYGPRIHVPTASPASMPASMPSPNIEQQRPSVPPPSRVPISAMITPAAQKTTSQSSSSSGKRRRARSMRPDQGAEITQETRPFALRQPELQQPQPQPPHQQLQQPQYESPYGMIDSDETSARAALVRHREDAPALPSPSVHTQSSYAGPETGPRSESERGTAPPAPPSRHSHEPR